MPDATDTATSPAARLADLNRQLIAARREQADATRATGSIVNGLPRDPDPADEVDALFARRRAADARVQRLTAQIELARADAREALEVDCAPLLDELAAGLTAARTRLTDAARTAREALTGLLSAADGYRQTVDVTRSRLNAAGFDRITRNALIGTGFDADRFPTRDDGSRLYINGTAWPATLSAGVPFAWAVAHAATAAGPSSAALVRFAQSLLGADRDAADALMSDALIAEQARP